MNSIAWLVNVIKPLQYYEESLQGLQNLINLALASPFTATQVYLHLLHFHAEKFVSNLIHTIRLANNILHFLDLPGEHPALEEPIHDPTVAIGSGYGESKWIAERMLIIAKEKTGLSTTSIRTGILCGDRNGYWTTTDAFPLIVKTGPLLNCLCDVGVSRAFPIRHLRMANLPYSPVLCHGYPHGRQPESCVTCAMSQNRSFIWSTLILSRGGS